MINRHAIFCACRLLFCLFLSVIGTKQVAAQERPNFLFVAIDDLNDFAGGNSEEPGNFLQVIYPNTDVRREVVSRLTPNLDALAARCAPFLRSYCSSALCGPSRTSLMTGRLPHQSGYYKHDRHFRTYETLADAITLPQRLKEHGYFTTGVGKLFHTGKGTVDGPLKDDWADARNSWNVWVNHPNGCGGGEPSRFSPPDGGLLQFGPSRLSLKQTGDWMTADFAARLLENGTAETVSINSNQKKPTQTVTLPTDQPFFMGCGLFRPHLPFYAPRKFFDKFPVDEMTGLNAENLRAIIDDLNDLEGDAKRFSDIGNGKMKVLIENAARVGGDNDDARVAAWREIVQAYLACVSFADTCVGRIVEGLDASPQRDNTVLVLWSDHGYHLGSKFHIAKQALWEEANHVVTIIRDPRNAASCNGQPRRQIVSLSDLYPTICSLAGVAVPANVGGTDLTPLLQSAEAPEIHEAVLMTYQPGNHSLRTPTHRFMRYKDGATELYDLVNDPTQQKNLAGRVEFALLQQQLEAELASRVKGEVLDSANSQSESALDVQTRKTQKQTRRKAANATKRNADKASGNL